MKQRRFTGVIIGRSLFPLLIVQLTLVSPYGRLWSAQTDLFVGSWRWVPEESRSTPNITYKLKFVFENGQLREELDQSAVNEDRERASGFCNSTARNIRLR
jgi:hypothetical protein